MACVSFDPRRRAVRGRSSLLACRDL